MTSPAVAPIRVLLVDDHQSILWGLVRLIEGEPHIMQVVGSTSDAADVLKKTAETKPDVVVLDIDLGQGKSGIDLIPHILETVPRAHVLMLTGVRDQATRDRAIMAGASGIVFKEEPAEIILRAIEKVHRGEVWLDRQTVAKVLLQLSRPHEKHRDPIAEKIASLTRKEREVISAITHSGGAANRALAEQLHISEHTLRNHLSAIYSKLNVSNRLELYLFATQHNLM